MKAFHLGASLLALAALSSCNETKTLNGTMTLLETEPVVMNDAGGAPVQLQDGPTEVVLDNGVLTVHNNTTNIILNFDKKLVKDLSNFTIPGSVVGQPITLTGTRATVDVDQHASPTLESCIVRDPLGIRPEPRCASGRAHAWRCAWGTRPVTHFSSTKTDEFTIRFTRDSDNHEVANFKARLSFHRNEGASGGFCHVDPLRLWNICDYRCVAPAPVRPPVVRPNPRPVKPGTGPKPGQARPRDRDGDGQPDRNPPRGRPGRPLPPPPGEELVSPPAGFAG